MVAARPLRRGDDPQPAARPRRRRSRALDARAPHVRRCPRWAGTLTDTRIAYLAQSGLRVVGGRRAGDRLLDPTATQQVAPAWVPGRLLRPRLLHGSGTIVRRERSRAPMRWRRHGELLPLSLEWSDDGPLLAVTSARRVVVLDADGRVVRTIALARRDVLVSVGVPPAQPSTRRRGRLGARSELKLVDVDRPGHARLLFAGPGASATWLVAGRDGGCSSTGRRRTSGCSCAARRCTPSGTSARSSRAATSCGPPARLAGRWSPVNLRRCSLPVTASPTQRSSSARTSP